MSIINIDDIMPGMILAEDLVAPNGRLILTKGSIIEDKHLQIFKSWGVTEAEIEGQNGSEGRKKLEDTLDPEILEQSKQHINDIFSLVDQGHPAIQEIIRLCALSTAQKASQNKEYLSVRFAPPETLENDADEEIGSIEDMVNRELELASFPDIYFRIVEVLNSPRSSFAHAADVVSKDTSLSAKLLQLVNSAFYGLPAKVDTISHAITIIGSSQLATLALGISVIQYFDAVPPEYIDMKRFWEHSIGCGTVAAVLARHIKGLSEERMFTAGIIHDIGRLVMLKKHPKSTLRSIHESYKAKCPLYDAEEQIFGFDHAAIGSRMLKEWQFPPALEQILHHHHSPSEAMNSLEPAILHIADIISLGMSDSGGSYYVPPLVAEAWERLGLSPSVLPVSLRLAERRIEDAMQAFFS